MFQQTATNTAMHKQTDKPPLKNVLFTCKHTTNHLGIIQMTFDHQTAKIQRKRTPHNEKIKYFFENYIDKLIQKAISMQTL